MEQIARPSKTKRLERDSIITNRYTELFKQGDQITAVCDIISEETGVKFSTVYRVIKSFRNG